MEDNLVDQLVKQATKKGDEDKGFEGFDSKSETSENPEERQPELSEEEESTEDFKSMTSANSVTPAQSTNETLKESEIRLLVDQVTDRITPIIQACCVTDRVEKAERNAEEWKSLANLMLKNPQFATKKLSIGPNETMSKISVGALGRHPMDQTWEMFIQTPMSQPIWEIMVKFDLHPTSSTFSKWWKKVRSDSRTDTWTKLSKYLQAMQYYNDAANEFWRKFSVNPTYFSIQRICTELVTQANFLKATGLDLQKIQEKLICKAGEVATSSGQVGVIEEILANIWPAGFKPHRLHYDNEPFENITLFAQEDENLCMNSAQLKGFNFMPENPKELHNSSSSTTSTANPVVSKPKISAVTKMIEEILNA